MNSKNIFAVSIAAILSMSGAALADELVQLGAIGGRASVSYIKRDPEKKSVAANGSRQGTAGTAGASGSVRSEKAPGKLVAHTQSVNNGVTVTYYTESR